MLTEEKKYEILNRAKTISNENLFAETLYAAESADLDNSVERFEYQTYKQELVDRLVKAAFMRIG